LKAFAISVGLVEGLSLILIFVGMLLSRRGGVRHSSFLHSRRWPQAGSWFLIHLCNTAQLPWYLSHQSSAYIHISPLLVTLYDTNKVSVIEVLEMSWFVFCIQTCDHFHLVIKVTTEFCSPSKFTSWLPFVCCPQLHILLFPQCKPPIPINWLTFIIESL
jgi:hypothetical protein